MKKLRILILFFIFAAFFTFSVSAEESGSPEEFYTEQYKNSGAEDLEDALPDPAKDYFSQNGIDPSDYNWVNNLSAESVFKHIFSPLFPRAQRLPLRRVRE